MKSLSLGFVFVSLAACAAEPMRERDENVDATNLDATTIRAEVRGMLDRDFTPPVVGSMPFVDENVVQVGWDELEASGAGTTSGGFYPPQTHGWLAIEN